MKIKESQLRKIVRESLEEYTTFSNNDSLYGAYETMKEMLGAETLLEELVQAMSDVELRESLEYIDKNNDLGVFENESEDEEELYEGKINPEDYDDDEDDEYIPRKQSMKRDGKKIPKMRKN